MNAPGHAVRMIVEYKEFLPPAALKDHFLCFWTQEIRGSGDFYEHRVLPDACIDIVLVNDEAPVVVGPWTKPFLAQLQAGSQITGARLHPGRASSLLGMPASELLNQSIPAAAIGGAIRETPLEKVMEQQNAAARLSALGQVLMPSLSRSAPFDQAVLVGVRWLSRRPRGRVEQLSRWIGISERQLHRRFSAAIGYGPKTFQSVMRFQRLLKNARQTGAKPRLADLAAMVGYADQAHMTREVHRLAQLRPTLLLHSTESTLEMSDLFKS
jgi:AraC-like DNA-binding protein